MRNTSISRNQITENARHKSGKHRGVLFSIVVLERRKPGFFAAILGQRKEAVRI